MYTRNDIKPSVHTIILHCDPFALVERLDTLMASKAAGNLFIFLFFYFRTSGYSII